MKLAVDTKDNELFVVKALSDSGRLPPHVKVDQQNAVCERIDDVRLFRLLMVIAHKFKDETE